jgi:hypothetical protein
MRLLIPESFTAARIAKAGRFGATGMIEGFIIGP